MYLLFSKSIENEFCHLHGVYDTLDIETAVEKVELGGEVTKVNENTFRVRTMFERVYRCQFVRINDFDKLDKDFQQVVKHKLLM